MLPFNPRAHAAALAELSAAGSRPGLTLDDDSPRFLARLRAQGLLDDGEWAHVLEWTARALGARQALSRSVAEREDVLWGEVGARDASWLQIVRAERLLGRRVPEWAALWLWELHPDETHGIWRRAAPVAARLGYAPWGADDEPPEGDRAIAEGGEAEPAGAGPRIAVGADGAGAGWLAVVLADGRFREAAYFATFAALLDRHRPAPAIAVDVPIGLPATGMREADGLAAKRIGRQRSSVFAVPPRAALEAPAYAEARAVAKRLGERGVSSQAYCLREKIFEVEDAAAANGNVFEAHPEVTFAAMAGAPLAFAKKTWNGLEERRALLERAGIVLPAHLPDAGPSKPDDVADAAATAWTADRIACGTARTVPEEPPRDAGGRATMAIWY